MISYRFATGKDINMLVELRLQFIEARTDNGNFFSIFQNCKEYFEHAMKNSTCEVILAYDDDKLIGEGMIFYYEAIPSLYNIGGFTGNVENLYVSLKYRQNGVGGTMLSKLMDSAKKKGVDVIFANTSDRSEKLFAEHGFANIHNSMIYQG